MSAVLLRLLAVYVRIEQGCPGGPGMPRRTGDEP